MTRPASRASWAFNTLPPRMISFARPSPIRRARRWVPPKPGIMPSPISGWPKVALSEASRRSQAAASSQPPPKAAPLTAAMTGLGLFWMRSMAPVPLWSLQASTPVRPERALTSAPAAKALLPAPVRMMTPTSLHETAQSRKSQSSAQQAAFIAFLTSGRLTVSTAIPPASSSR